MFYLFIFFLWYS